MGRYIFPNSQQLSISWGPGGAHGPAAIRISIEDGFEWPENISAYRVSMEIPESKYLIGAAWLSKERRSAAILPLTRVHSIHLDLADLMAQRAQEENPDTQILRELSELIETDNDTIGRSIDILELHQWFDVDDAIPEDIKNHNVFLEVVNDKGEILAREGPGRQQEKRINWQRRINDPEDPCHGLMPEDCVYKVLDEIRQELCRKLSFLSIECLFLSSWLEADPKYIKVACNLGAAAATTDAITGQITVNGHEFLCGKWLDEVLIHEISHVIDFYSGKIEKYKRYKKAIKEGSEARDELTRLDRNPFVPNPEDWRKLRDCARQKLESATRITEECYNDYLKELLETECRALFYVLSHSATLGHPGVATQCIIDAIKHMMAQLVDLYQGARGDAGDYVKPTLKDCFERIRNWINQPENSAVKDAFEKDKANENSDDSWWDILRKLIEFFS